MSVIHSTFTGKLTMITTSPQFPKKEIPDFQFKAEFDSAGTWVLPKASFRHREAAISTPLGNVDLIVTLAEDGKGTWSADTFAIDVVFEFDVDSGPVQKHSQLDLKFTTGAHGGDGGLPTIKGLDPVKATGQAGLTASGKFSGSLLTNATCLVQLEGTFKPNPWA